MEDRKMHNTNKTNNTNKTFYADIKDLKCSTFTQLKCKVEAFIEMKKLWRKNFPDNMRVIKDNHVSINEWLSLEDTLDKLLIIRDKLVGTDAMALRVEVGKVIKLLKELKN